MSASLISISAIFLVGEGRKLVVCWLNSSPFNTQSVHIHCRHTILAHLFFRDFSFPSLFSYSPRLSLSLSLFNSLPLSLTHSLPHLSLSLILSSSLSLSHSPFSLYFSLSASFPPFLSFNLRLFNLFNDHSPSPLSPPEFCVWNALCMIGISLVFL